MRSGAMPRECSRTGSRRATASRAGWARRCSPASCRSPRRAPGWCMCRSIPCCAAPRPRTSSPTAAPLAYRQSGAARQPRRWRPCRGRRRRALEGWLAPGPALPASAHDPDTLAALLYTSGSTGRPKGVMLSHANLWLGAVSVAHYLGLGPDDRTLCLLPLAFDYGQNQLLLGLVRGRLRDRVRLSPPARRGQSGATS